MFGDDTNITFAASTLIDLENGLNSELRSLNPWLISNKLSCLNVAKTEFMVIGSNQRLHSFSDDQIDIEIDAKLITKVKEAKSGGIITDEHLSWSNQIGELRKKISSAIYDTKFFISLFERAFKMMTNGVYFIVTALLVPSYSRFWFMQVRLLVTSYCWHKMM